MRPRSLVSRIALLVAFVFIASYIAQVFLLQTTFFELATAGVVRASAGATRMAQNVLQQTPRAQRDAAAKQLMAGNFKITRVTPTFNEPGIVKNQDVPVDDILDANSSVYFHRSTLPNGATAIEIAISAEVEGETWWFIQNLGLQPNFPTFLLGLLASLATFTGLGLLFGVRTIARPLSALAHDIGARKSALRSIPVSRSDSTELRRIKETFNELVDGVAVAAKTRQQLLAGVSHDLRTPLSRLRLRIETQIESDIGDALLSDLYGIEHIVNQFLAYVQGDTKAQLGKREPLSETVELVLAQYSEQDVHAHLDECALKIPDLAIQRLLSNLIDNAIDHGKTPVKVRLSRAENYFELTVFDQGAGMSAAEFEQALQPFVRLDVGRTTQGHCGLGLAIVAQMAKQIGGALSIARDENWGFGISLRLSIVNS